MLKHVLVAVVVMAATLSVLPGDAAARGQFGGGLHYLRGLGDIDEAEFNKNSFSILGTYQHDLGLIKLEGDLEYMFDFYGGGEGAWRPQAYALLGGFIYGGLGIGASYFNDDWANDPFYNIRLGINLGIMGLSVDTYATYQFWDSDDLSPLIGDNLDSLTLAAIVLF